MAENDLGAGRDFQPEMMSSDGDTTVETGPSGSLYAPDVGPPRAMRCEAEGRTVLGLRFGPSRGGCHFKFTMDLVLVVMQA